MRLFLQALVRFLFLAAMRLFRSTRIILRLNPVHEAD